MAGQPLAYRGSMLMNIVDVADLEIAALGPGTGNRRSVQCGETRPTGASQASCGRGSPHRCDYPRLSTDIWTANDALACAEGAGAIRLRTWGHGKNTWRCNPFDIKKAFLASRTTAQLLPQKILARPSIPAGRVSA